MTRLTTAHGGVGLGLRGFEHQFVVHLQQHLRVASPACAQRARHADHGAADDVGGGALDRGVDRGALGELALGRPTWRGWPGC